MNQKSGSFRIQGSRSECLSILDQRFSLRRGKPSLRRFVYLDTFDWRLYRKKRILRFIKSDAAQGCLELINFKGNLKARLILPSLPDFSWNLPESRVRDLIEPVISVRRLLPITSVTISGSSVRVLDDLEKTVVRISLNEQLQIHDNEKRVSLPGFMEVRSVRGYENFFKQVMADLETQLEPVPQSRNELEILLEAAGKKPLSFSSKLNIRLDPHHKSGEATREILRILLDTIKATEPGTRQNLDSEFLHDFRVAVRRTRSALGQIKKVFDPEKAAHFKKEFSWLGKLTGPTRDLDVYLLKYDDYQKRLPESIRQDLLPLIDFLKKRHHEEQTKLAGALSSKRYKKLIRDWERFLSVTVDDSRWKNSSEPAKELASKRIRRVYKKIIREGEQIGDLTPAEKIHRIRIDCKKLRYLMEFFQSLYPKKEIRRGIKALRRLQDNLGDFNDYEVQQAKLMKYAHEMQESGCAGPGTLLAMGRLMQQLNVSQQEEREKFTDRFREFASSNNREQFHRLFSKVPTAE